HRAVWVKTVGMHLPAQSAESLWHSVAVEALMLPVMHRQSKLLTWPKASLTWVKDLLDLMPGYVSMVFTTPTSKAETGSEKRRYKLRDLALVEQPGWRREKP